MTIQLVLYCHHVNNANTIRQCNPIANIIYWNYFCIILFNTKPFHVFSHGLFYVKESERKKIPLLKDITVFERDHFRNCCDKSLKVFFFVYYRNSITGHWRAPLDLPNQLCNTFLLESIMAGQHVSLTSSPSFAI